MLQHAAPTLSCHFASQAVATDSSKSSRSDTQVPCMAPRSCPPPSTTETLLEPPLNLDRVSSHLSIRVRAPAPPGQADSPSTADVHHDGHENSMSDRPPPTLQDLPLEIQGLILDHLFGDVRPVASTSSPQSPSNRISSAMRHPRRKALADVTLVSATWRDLVQERIYRHIKIKGNCAGLGESGAWFSENFHLARHVRHIEFWVPVWADKFRQPQKSPCTSSSGSAANTPPLVPFHTASQLCHSPHSITKAMTSPASDPSPHIGDKDTQIQSPTYPSRTPSSSATLSEIFLHVACLFPYAKIFTLEGGHCKRASMIRQFPATLFPMPDRRLEVLPNIRTFAMRGAWNIMRGFSHWNRIAEALPGLQEWHCGYAKPRLEAYMTMSSIFNRLPIQVRHVNISLDGFYCKAGAEENSLLASSHASSLPSAPPSAPSPFSLQENQSPPHLCEGLGSIAPQLETLSFTGKICECFFRKAASVAQERGQVSRLRAVDLVVKSCCRLVAVKKHPTLAPAAAAAAAAAVPITDPGEESVSGVGMATDESTSISPLASPVNSSPNTNPDYSLTATTDTTTSPPHQHHLLIPSSHPTDALTSITNMAFIRSFERLIHAAVKSLHPSSLPSLNLIRIRHIDLDSAFPLLNPYFVFKGDEAGRGRCTGVWNDGIVEELSRSRPDALGWDHLHDGIGIGGGIAGEDGNERESEKEPVQGQEQEGIHVGSSNSPAWFFASSSSDSSLAPHDRTSRGRIYDRPGRGLCRKPTAIKGSAYRLLADAR